MLEDADLLSRRQAGGRRRHPGPASVATLAQLLARGAAGGEDRGGRGSCTASTATPRACSSSPRARRRTAAEGALARGRSCASTWRSSRAARRRAPARSTRRSGATAACARGGRSTTRPARGAHPLHARGGARRHDAAARSPRDRPHAPDPRPLRGDRPSCLRRPRIRGPGPLGLDRQFLHAARLARPAVQRRAARVASPLPDDLARALARAAGAAGGSNPARSDVDRIRAEPWPCPARRRRGSRDASTGRA